MAQIDLTILVPARNEENGILGLLQSLTDSAFPKRISTEIVILPNGCSDRTVQVCKNFIFRHKISTVVWKLIEIEQAGKPNALNTGLQNSRSEIVINVDSDCRLEKRCLNKLFSELEGNLDIKVAGALDIPDFFGMDRDKLLYQYQRVQQIWREERGRVLPVGRAIGYKKSFFGKFPEKIHSEDTWIALTAASRFSWESVKVLSDAIVYFIPPRNWLDYIRQETIFDAGYLQVMKLYPNLQSAYEKRRDGYIRRSEKEIETSILSKLMDEGIPKRRLKELSDIINKIKIENSAMMAELLIDSSGKWEPVRSTKNYKNDHD